MNKTVRFLLVLGLLVGILAVAGGAAVWASPATKAPDAVSEKAAPALPSSGSHLGTVAAEGCGGVSVNPGETKGICGAAVVTGGDVFATVGGEGIVSLYFNSGSATICFAAPHAGVVYFQPHPGPDDTWIPLATGFSGGRACATTSNNGHYKFE